MRHPKTVRLARSLGISKFAAVGVIHTLWDFTAEQYERGGAPRDALAGLEDALEGSNGDGGAKAITALREAGFIDQSRDGKWSPRNWMEFQGGYFRERDRKAKYRGQKQDIPVHKDGQKTGPSRAKRRDKDGTATGQGSPPSVPSVPSQHTDKQTDTPPLPPRGGAHDVGSFHQHPSPEDNGFDSAIRVLEIYARVERAFAGGKQILQTVRGFCKRLQHEGKTAGEIKQEGKRLMDVALPGMKIWDVLQAPEAKKKRTKFEEARDRMMEERQSKEQQNATDHP